jgi:hypothetical protein
MPELRSIECQKREPCVYCGSVDHPAIFACPRIRSVTVYENGVYEDEHHVNHREVVQREITAAEHSIARVIGLIAGAPQ